ncbi:unnamed protein product [Victoria cruziana]
MKKKTFIRRKDVGVEKEEGCGGEGGLRKKSPAEFGGKKSSNQAIAMICRRSQSSATPMVGTKDLISPHRTCPTAFAVEEIMFFSGILENKRSADSIPPNIEQPENIAVHATAFLSFFSSNIWRAGATSLKRQ